MSGHGAHGPADGAFRRLPREMILASAGSGKTFRISSRIVGLLAHGEAPDAILASTFTRKAAGEILGRVLVRLADAALDPEEARALAGHAELFESSPVRLDCGRCLELLTDLVRRLHRLNIGTLDAFFIRAAQSFAYELGLPPAWRIADEPTYGRVRSEALQEILRRADTDALVELVRLANRGEAARSVHDRLLDDLDELYGIVHRIDPTVANPWDVGLPEAEATVDEAGGDRLAEALDDVEPPTTKAGRPSKRWVDAIAAAADRLRNGEWEDFLSGGLGAKIVDESYEYYGNPIREDIARLLDDGVGLAREVLARRIARQANALGKLVMLYDAAFEEVQRREGAYRFDDVTRLLGGADPLGARLDLYYRLDMRTRHLLLDEFQDTSLAQWDALRPLADELLSGAEGDRAAVIVADPKQSIYGWRGAEPELVHHVGEWYAMERDVLARSWRSSPAVLDVVNRVFDGIERSPVLDDGDRDLAAEWARSFSRHEAVHDRPGYVRIAVGPEDEGRGNDRPRLLTRAAELIRSLREEAPGFSIGVLTRRNQAVARLIHELRIRGVEASEEGGNPLTDAASVTAVLSLLRLADHPDDRIARYHVARSPVGAARGYTDPGDDRGARRLSHEMRDALLREGYGATLNALAGDLAGDCDARELRRLMQLVEFGFRYDDEATLRPTEFVRRVETERVEDPSGAGVRVMTVHQSKGLEFDIVVLPELDVKIFQGGGRTALPYREEPAGPVTRVFPYVKKSVRALFPAIEDAYRQQRAGTLRDALSGLYVAMTRARHALHVVIAPDGERPGTATTPARMVREALAPDREAVAGDDAFFTHGDPRWFEHVERDGEGAERATPDPVPEPRLRAPDGRRVRVLPRRTPSGMEGGSTVELGDLLRLDAGPSRERGTIVHAWCEEIEWIEDGLPDDDRLRRIARRVGPRFPEDRIDELIGEFRAWLRQPKVAAALRRDEYEANATVEREIRFVHRADDAIMEGIIDRLVVWEEAGAPAGAEILDYKTDRIPAGDREALDARVEVYRPQIDAYRTAVADLYGLDAARVQAKLLFIRAGEVVPL